MSDFTITARSVIGTGDPFDIITMIPLIRSHGIGRACAVAQDEGEPECEDPIQRAVIVDRTDPPGVFEPGTPLGFCERHFQAIR